MKHFLIYTNEHKDQDRTVTKRICQYLEGKGQRVMMRTGESRQAGRRMSADGQEVPEDIPGDVDCMLVLGGDGTVLRAARETKALHIPIIGVKLGTLGYMTEIEPEYLEEALDRLIAGDYAQESRMMLKGKAVFADGRTEEGWALNDIVISRVGSLQIIKFRIYVNGQFLHEYNADGVIVTTPTGSTGYNLSAGGPLVEPKARLIMLTPICPHTLNQRSIIFSPEDVIEIEIPEGREDRIQTVEANFDGSHVIPLRTGDRVRVTESGQITEFIKLNRVSFLEVLQRKMTD